jgi:hypothetical protein
LATEFRELDQIVEVFTALFADGRHYTCDALPKEGNFPRDRDDGEINLPTLPSTPAAGQAPRLHGALLKLLEPQSG